MGRRGRQPRTTPHPFSPRLSGWGEKWAPPTPPPPHHQVSSKPGLRSESTWEDGGGGVGHWGGVPLEASPDPVAAWESMI